MRILSQLAKKVFTLLLTLSFFGPINHTHATLGCTTASVKGTDCASGAIGGSVAEVFSEAVGTKVIQDGNLSESDKTITRLTGQTGAILTNALAGNKGIAHANTALDAGTNAVDNNMLPLLFLGAKAIDLAITAYDTYQDAKAIKNGEKTLTEVAKETAFSRALSAIVPGGSVINKMANKALKGRKIDTFAKNTKEVSNPIPDTVARIVPDTPITRASGTLGESGTHDVFITAADDIKGLNAKQIANRLTIPESPTEFRIIEFPTPTNIASPINRNDPGFIGGGLTAGGAREFVIPNSSIPVDANTRFVP